MTKPRTPRARALEKARKNSPRTLPTPIPPPMEGRRRHRPRPTPTWLLEQQDMDDIARRRCLMVLSVLSGETPVTDAIASTDISRQMYYQLEERALKAMMRALTPGLESQPVSGQDPAALRRVTELEARVKQLEQEKRRAERLLLVTRKVVKAGPMKTGLRGRPPKHLSSASAGSKPSRFSRHSPKSRTEATEAGTEASTLTPGGVVARQHGTES